MLQNYKSGAWRPLTSVRMGWSSHTQQTRAQEARFMTVVCRLYSANDIAINWLEGMAMKAFMKQITVFLTQ